jgi:DNA-binding transcriptional LysR family regulator
MLSKGLSCLSMHDLRRLRAFHEVAVRGSFSAAALELGYAQSVVSHHLAALEAEFGLTLVDRSSRPVRLTPAGEELHRHAIQVLGRVAEAQDGMRALAGLQSGTLRISAFSTACTSFVAPAIARFQTAHPEVEVSLEQADPHDALRRVRAGDVDVAVVFTHRPPPDPSDDDQGLSWSHLGDDPFRLILPPDHRLASKRRLRVGDLAGERFCAPPRSGIWLTYHEMLEEFCAQGSFEPDIAYTIRETAVGQALVAAGLCISIMGEHTVPRPRPGVAVRPLPGARKPKRTILAAWLPNRRVPSVAPMIELLTEEAGARFRR